MSTYKRRLNNKGLYAHSFKARDIFFDAASIFLASLAYSVAINTFTAPNNIAPAGLTGVSIMINYLFGFPIGISFLVMNIPLFVLFFLFVGKRALVKTVIATVTTSLAIDLLGTFLPVYVGDRLLASLFAGLLSGAGLGLVFLRGATTGGTDIIGRLLRNWKPHISMGSFILIIDLFVVCAAGFVYKSLESMLYAIIVFFISSRVINYLLYGTGNSKMINVVTDKANEIASAITSETQRGVTILPVQGAYSGKDKKMLLCVVRANEVAIINKIVRRFDENPFIIISQAGEVFGLGFKTYGENKF